MTIMDLDSFINSLPFPTEEKPSASVKLAEELQDLPAAALLELAGVSRRADTEDVLMKLAFHGPDKSEWLEQFVGSPLYEQAIALCEQDLAMEQQHLQARIARRQAEQAAGSWEQESNDRDMMRIQKHQLTLALHKHKAQQQAAMAAATAPSAPGPAAMPAIPPEAPPEAVAEKMAALSDAKQEKGLGKALTGLAKSKMDPDRKRGLAKGLAKAIKKETKEGDPVKLSAFTLREALGL